MQAVSADRSVPEPSPENSGISESLKRSHLNNGVLEKFAQNMTESIIQLCVRQMEVVEAEVDCGVSTFNENQEMSAGAFAAAVIEAALREACRGHQLEGSQGSAVSVDGAQAENMHFMDETQSEGDFLHMDTEMDPCKATQTSKDTHPCHPPLSHPGLPVVGSLDYPDAPPTTPLLPELEMSRRSFTRKLKGGLAKVFLPSPPPPTPKDKEGDSGGAVSDPRAELIEHLMHSLPTDDLAREYFEVGSHRGAKMEAFAEALSCDIIAWVLRAKDGKQAADDGDLSLLAHQLAQTIISSSLDEAKIPF